MQIDLLRNYYKNDFQSYTFPTTRYQGSKSKIADWISDELSTIQFDTFLDAFGGTGVISYKAKQMGKEVYYNDILSFNCIIAEALLKNGDTIFTEKEVDNLLTESVSDFPKFIFDNFHGIFYTDEENLWLDEMVFKINKIEDARKRAIAWFALFQSCIIKRPYNLFHRSNLSVRTNEVKRSFGNKKTWDTPFEVHFKKFIDEANQAVFTNGRNIEVHNKDVLELDLDKSIDLVYIDTPYISSKGIGTDYIDFYHFLEGMVSYKQWDKLILEKYKHKPIKGKGTNSWTKKNLIHDEFDKLISKFKDSILVISYREDGIPSVNELVGIIKKYKNGKIEIKTIDYKYVLSNKESKEVLIIAH